MRRSIFAIFILTAALSIPDSGGQTSPSTDSSAAPLRVAVAGMAHGHTNGFLQRVKNRHDVEIIGVAEPDRKLFDRYAADFHLDASLYHADLDEMLPSFDPILGLLLRARVQCGRGRETRHVGNEA